MTAIQEGMQVNVSIGAYTTEGQDGPKQVPPHNFLAKAIKIGEGGEVLAIEANTGRGAEIFPVTPRMQITLFEADQV